MNSQNLEKLKKYGRILNEEFKKDALDPVIGRDPEIRRIIQILSRRKKNNPVLIGDAGIGKTAIVEGLTQRIENQDVPTNLLKKQIFELNLASLISGAKMHGEFEERLKTIIDIVQKDSDILIFIDELHLIVGAGRTQGAIDASNILKPALARGELRCIGATTSDEYRQYIEKDAALERRFQKMMIEEPSVEETITILRGIKSRFESFHEITIKDNALVFAAKLSNQYIPSRKLPDKAIDLIDEACAKIKTEITSVPSELDQINRKTMQLEIEKKALVKEEQDLNAQEKLKAINNALKHLLPKKQELEKQWQEEKAMLKEASDLQKDLIANEKELKTKMQEGNYDRAGELKYQTIPRLKEEIKALKKRHKQTAVNLLKDAVDENDIAAVVANWTKIPVQKLLSAEKAKILSIFKKMKEKIKAQDHAIKAVADAIVRSRAGLKEPHQPIASFLFVGSTGVGKTLVAKVLSEIMFSDAKKIIRIDMSEYNTKYSVSRLIGAPPGYIGYDKGGQLTEKVKNNPYSVILLDEIEKSHPEVQSLLLQLLEEGRLTDSLGQTIDFKNTVIIMTSNIGGELIDSDEYSESNVLKKVQENMSNEFFNRIDEVIVFNPLDQIAIAQIVDLELRNFLTLLVESKNIVLQYDEKVKQQVLAANWSINYGARPIKRYISKHIAPLIAQKIINEEIVPNQVYLLTSEKKEFKIRKAILN